MSKRKKTGFPDELFVVVSVDRMNPENSFESEPMAREMAEKEYNDLTDNGKRKTPQDKNCLQHYELRPFSLDLKHLSD